MRRGPRSYIEMTFIGKKNNNNKKQSDNETGTTQTANSVEYNPLWYKIRPVGIRVLLNIPTFEGGGCAEWANEINDSVFSSQLVLNLCTLDLYIFCCV